MNTLSEMDNHDLDAPVDSEIAACLSARPRRSFFLFAGAGSGKTRSLVTPLDYIQRNLGESLRSKGQRVAVITYTNAASDEIKRRTRFDPLIDVRTIHSFAWSLIEGLNRDIREWLRTKLAEDIRVLQAEEGKGRKGTKASATRISRIASKTRRLANLDHIKRFVYSPTGDNRGRDALNHVEVLQLTAYFLTTKPSMRSILAGRFPVLLIDESQDTNSGLIDAFFAAERALQGHLTLGLFGDMMQRIFFDGKDGLGDQLPPDWAKPRKQLNHRCPKRIVTLINQIRRPVDDQQQQPRSDSIEGHVRLFLFPSDTADKLAAERAAAEWMSKVTGDDHWLDKTQCKTLTLEHRMAATRMGFLDIFTPLYSVESWRTSFLEGTLPASRFFTRDVLPLINAMRPNDRFAITRILKSLSPLLSPETLRHSKDTRGQLKIASNAMDQLLALWNNSADPTLLQVLSAIARLKLLEIPEILQPHVDRALATAKLAPPPSTTRSPKPRPNAVPPSKNSYKPPSPKSKP